MEEILDSGSFASESVIHTRASKGQRFANHFIDGIIYYLISFLVGVIYAYALGDSSMISQEPDSIDLFSILLAWIVLIGYYAFSEYFLGGKTIGKFATNTRAVNIDDSRLSFKEALLRSLSRIVPFEAFSFLGSDASGWHDKWTDTKVIIDTDWEG